MKTRFSSIVKYRHSQMQEAEAALQQALARVQKAKKELEEAKAGLADVKAPKTGAMQNFLASRTLLDAQLRLIEKNEEWVAYEESQVNAAREQLQKSMQEYEKFKYLETEEIKKIQKTLQKKENKLLDELAMIGFNQKEERR